MEEAIPPLMEEKIHVAVGKNVEKNMSTVMWALQNGEVNKICIVHVHQPPQMIPVMGAKFAASTVDDEIVRVFRGKERKKTEEILEQYLHICRQNRVKAEKLFIEMDSIEEGIVRLITQHGISKLVMGAASDKHYSARMPDLRSKKAIFVRQHAPVNCHIWFTCKGHLICAREAVIFETKTISMLLSEFQQLVSRGKNTDLVQDVVQSGGGMVSDLSEDSDKRDKESRTSSFRFGSDGQQQPEKTGEAESSSGSGLVKEGSNPSFSKEREEEEHSSQESFCCIC